MVRRWTTPQNVCDVCVRRIHIYRERETERERVPPNTVYVSVWLCPSPNAFLCPRANLPFLSPSNPVSRIQLQFVRGNPCKCGRKPVGQ